MSVADRPEQSGALAPDDAADSVAPSGLFVRKSSGLVRELGIRDAFALNIGGVNPTGIGFAFLFILAGFPGTDLTLPLLVVCVGAILLSLTYSQLIASMPRSGADFIYTSRLFTPWVGASVGFAVLLAVAMAAGAIDIQQLASVYLPFIFQTLGDVFHSSALTQFATTLAGRGWTVAVSVGICVLTGWLLIQRVSLMARATYWLVMAGVLAVVVIIAEFVFHGQSTFQHAFDAHVHNPHAYAQLVSASHHAGGLTGAHSAAIWSSIALCWVLFGGAQYANYTGGELRRPGWTFRGSTLLCIGVSFVLTLGAWLALKHAVGLGFIQSASFLNANDPASYGRIAGDVTAYVPSYVGLIASNPVSKIVIAVGFAAGVLSLIFAVAIVLSRLMFALSFDRLLPSVVAEVRPKSHAPVVAAVVVTVLFILGTMLVIYTSVLQVTRNYTLIFEFVYALVSLGAAILPWRRRDLYEMAPKMVGTRVLGLPAITVVGGISTVYWTVLLYLGATKTQVSGGYDTRSVVTLAGSLLLGVVVYAISRIAVRRKGLDLGLALHELPPE